MVIAQVRIALADALHIRGAEYWLRLGEALQALCELEQLSRRARRHPWAEAVFLEALSALRGPAYFDQLSKEEPAPAVNS